jgi:hypothetical protein
MYEYSLADRNTGAAYVSDADFADQGVPRARNDLGIQRTGSRLCTQPFCRLGDALRNIHKADRERRFSEWHSMKMEKGNATVSV